MSQSSRQAVLDFMRGSQSGVQVYPAELLSLQGDSCTVRLLSSDLEIDEVRLSADPDQKGKVVFYPRVGSTVLVGCIENELSSLYVAQCSEIDSFDIVIGDAGLKGDKDQITASRSKTSVKIEQDKLSFVQDTVSVELGSKKVSVTNGTVSLKTLFTDLTTLLKTFIVITTTGPSTAVSPTSLTSITQLETKINQLLS